ncbi:hypothetical protein [Sphingomonas lenta]|uniref:Uncharacterized protein n=1 Tax=Sphingomonas lenta TaxID=1141887 RepID=A0A2A2SAN2_9SPHN|nr:hypothetical protein [Sphingomonas lenta]PAX06318.1 hypothetical protein CKY28_17680 [Sphingomonas lenta]
MAFTVALLVVIVPWAVWVFRITGNPTPAQREAVGPVLVSGGLLLGTASGGLTLALLRLQPQVMLLELRRELLRGDQGEENSI